MNIHGSYHKFGSFDIRQKGIIFFGGHCVLSYNIIVQLTSDSDLFSSLRSLLHVLSKLAIASEYMHERCGLRERERPHLTFDPRTRRACMLIQHFLGHKTSEIFRVKRNATKWKEARAPA